MTRLKQFFSRKRLYTDMDDEIAFHLEQRVEELVAEGMPREKAEAKARKDFGNVAAVKQTAREAWGWKWIEDLFIDLRFGVRMLNKNRVLTLAAVLTLALGIGANTAIFTLLYGLVLRSLPASNPGQLVRLGVASTAQPDDQDGSQLTYHMYEEFRQEQTSFRDLSAWNAGEVQLRDKQGLIQRYDAAMVTGNAFGLMGLQPYRGRLIEPFDDVPGGPSTGWPVVLGYGFWKDNYGGEEDIIGKKITATDVTAIVVGIAPPGFEGVWPGMQVKMYFPLNFEPIAARMPDLMEEKGENLLGVSVIGRLKPGVTLARANSELTQLQTGLLDRYIPPRLKQIPYFAKAYLVASSARTGLPNYLTIPTPNPCS